MMWAIHEHLDRCLVNGSQHQRTRAPALHQTKLVPECTCDASDFQGARKVARQSTEYWYVYFLQKIARKRLCTLSTVRLC
eukprot:SAG31_NODE_30316_length_382_cov_12.374558_1_plen_79_part_10